VKANGKSKGFGFVVLDSEEEQQKAMVAFDKYVLDGRELSVKVAFQAEQREGFSDISTSNTNPNPSSSPNTADTDKSTEKADK